MELLAPAGSEYALRAAIQSGADAVYLGGTRFSARSSCKNFNNDSLKTAIDYCHLRGKAVHVAANTLVKESECADFIDYIGFLNDIGADAVIIQDIGMAAECIKRFPDLPFHASTQMTCASLESAKYLESLGFSRAVLARELDIEAIDKISHGISIETEVFVHGAICMSYSGQCLMSSMIGSRSGNRGSCAQPCRLPYNFVNNGKAIGKGYLLSPKDMCLINHLAELEKAGVTSLKIEGRLKRAEYVSAVCGVYRKCLDGRRTAAKEEYSELLNAFNRSGFTDGYLTKNTGKGMMSYENPSNAAENIYTNEAKERCAENVENVKVPLRMELSVDIGAPARLTASDDSGNKAAVYGERKAEYALNVPLSAERAELQLKKLGGLPFVCTECHCDIDRNAVIPISEINLLRRKAVEEITKKRCTAKKRRKLDVHTEFEEIIPKKPILTASCANYSQVKACIESGIERIYFPGNTDVKGIDLPDNTELIRIMPPIDRENKNPVINYDGARLVSSYGQISRCKSDCYAGFRLNIANSYSLKLFSKCKVCELSQELTVKETADIKKQCDTEITVYGRLPLMTFENCPSKALGVCEPNGKYLTDRHKEVFPLLCSEGCFSVLYNSKPIYMADKLDSLKDTGVGFYKLEFTIESDEECKSVILDYQNALNGSKAAGMKENTFTRGHYFKKV